MVRKPEGAEFRHAGRARLKIVKRERKTPKRKAAAPFGTAAFPVIQCDD
jgi:hypothetical protein